MIRPNSAFASIGNRKGPSPSKTPLTQSLVILRLKTKHVEISLCMSCPTRAVTSGVAIFIQRDPNSFIVFVVNDKRFCNKNRRFFHRHCLFAALEQRHHRRLPSKRVKKRHLLLLQKDKRWLRLALNRVKKKIKRLITPLANLVSIRVHNHDKRLYFQQLLLLLNEIILDFRVVRARRNNAFDCIAVLD